jgi:hypothetical protein
MQSVNYFFDLSLSFPVHFPQELTSSQNEIDNQARKLQQVVSEFVKNEGFDFSSDFSDQVSFSLNNKKRKIEEIVSKETNSVHISSLKRIKRDDQELEDRGPLNLLAEEAIQLEFFSSFKPTRWFSLRRDVNGEIKIPLPPSLRKIKRLIYIFRNRKKNCFLIGKTGGSLNSRMSGYVTIFNEEGSENRVKKKGRKSFLMDVKSHPEHFDVGILYVLQPDDDLDFFEIQFIKYKKRHDQLYNDNGGGGGGSAHAEEKYSIYALPKPEIMQLTPQKYYPYTEGRGQVRLQWTPGLKERIKSLRAGLEEEQELAYVIKNMETEERYIGVSGDPFRRAREHGYLTEYYIEESDKFDPTRKTGFLHRAMAEEPEKFAFGVLPIQSVEQIDSNQRENYFLLEGISKVEQFVIQYKQTLISQNGFNGNRGGGGPIAKRATQSSVKKTLDFSTASIEDSLYF